jgi:hypothetical protein
MASSPRYRIAFVFHRSADISLSELSKVLIEIGEKTFKVVDEERWFHRRYKSEVNWRHDLDNNMMTAAVEGGEAVRACGSLVEWMLRNASAYLDDVDRDLKGFSVFQ